MKRYPTYKDSGVEWLGEVPEGWEVRPLWSLFRRVKRLGFPDAELLSVYRDYGVVPKSSRDDNFNNASEDLSLYQLVKVGDLAINKMKAWQGSVAISDYEGIVSPAYFIMSPSHECDSRFLHYLMRSSEYTFAYLTISKGIRPNQWDLEPQEHSRLPVLIPPLPEQHAITGFLDREAGKIDALVEEQRRLIALLAEKRQAVISHAVTKGLNATAPLKPSGIDWLGDIPEGWEVRRIKDLARIISKGTTPTTLGFDFIDEGVRFLKAENIGSDGSLTDAPAFFISEIADQAISRSQLESDDVLVVIAGATTGKSAVLHGALLPANTNQAVAFIRCEDPRNARWVQNWLGTQIIQNLIRLGSVQSAQPNLSMEDLGNIPILIPAGRQREAVIENLERSTAQLDALTEAAASTITLLQERRAALISAAVTGKIDVRDISSQSIPEPEPA